MSICVEITQEGVIRDADTPVDQCSSFVLVSADQHAFLTQTMEITSAEILEVFGISFGWVVLLSSIAYKIRVTKRVIKTA